MSFIEYKGGKAILTEEGKSLPSVKKLELYKHEDQIDAGLLYIYFMYNPDGMYKNLFGEEKKKKIRTTHLEKFKDFDFEEDTYFQKVIKDYINLHVLTMGQKFHARIIRDMESFYDYLSNIPWTRKGKVETNIEVVDPNGEKYIVPVKVEVDIDNSKEKIAAMAAVEKLLSQEEKWSKMIEQEKKQESNKSYKTLMEEK